MMELKFNELPLGQILRLSSGDFLSAENVSKTGDYPVYGGNGVLGYSEKNNFHKSEIVIGRVGALCGNVHLTPEKSWITDNALYVSKLLIDIDSDFLFEVLRGLNLNQYANKSGQPFISGTLIYPLPVKFPVLKAEQKNFAKLLSDKLTSVEQMRQAALQHKEVVEALQGALLREVFPYKEGDELPKGWKWEKIDNLAKVSKPRKKKVASSAKELTSFVPMDSVDDITGKITKTLFRPYDELGQSYTYFENGDIIFAKITPCMQNGKCAIVSEMKNDFGFGSSEYIVLTPTKPIYTKWVHYFLRTVEFRRAAEEHFTGSAGQQRVPTDFVQKYPIPFPDDEKIIEKLTTKLDKKHEEYFKLLQKAEAQLEAIEALPAAILREVFEFKTN